MESVTLPEGLTYLPSYIFSGMTSLKSVILPANLDTIGSYAFYNSGIENITIPKTVDDIGSYAFSNTPNLNKVTFEEGSQLDSICYGMFSYSGIKEITLPEEMKRVIAKVAEAEREKAAVITKAEGEVEAANNLAKAATVMGSTPGALHLRTLATLNDLSSDQSNTVVFAIPVEVLRALDGLGNKNK